MIGFVCAHGEELILAVKSTERGRRYLVIDIEDQGHELAHVYFDHPPQVRKLAKALIKASHEMEQR